MEKRNFLRSSDKKKVPALGQLKEKQAPDITDSTHPKDLPTPRLTTRWTPMQRTASGSTTDSKPLAAKDIGAVVGIKPNTESIPNKARVITNVIDRANGSTSQQKITKGAGKNQPETN